jgi:hypothetical protein
MAPARGRRGARTPVRGPALALLVSAAVTLGLSASAQAAGPPQIEATWVSAVTASSLDLHAEVNPEGLETTYRFEYETEAAFQHNLLEGEEGFQGAAKAPPFGEGELGSEATTQPALQHLSALKAATAYRYRILATNSAAPAGVAGPALAFTTQPGASGALEECPNAQLRFENGSFALPDCRAWEMVSPAEKNGGAIQGPGQNFGGDVLQAAPDGEAATFSSASSFGEGAKGAPPASQYIARRSAAGWVTENVTGPTVSGAYGEGQSGVPFQLFSADLARGLLLNGRRCAQAEACPRSYSLRESASGTLTPSPAQPDLAFAGASPDLRHPILSTCAALTPEATEVPGGGGGGCDPAEPNLYQWSGGSLALINILPGETHGTPGARLAAQAAAVSSDGSRVYFSQLEDGALYLAEAGQPTKLLPETTGGGAAFQTASADGSLAFFTKGGNLYRYDAVSDTTSAPLAGEVQGVLGASADGSYIYYAKTAGLFLFHAGTSTEVASGAAAAEPGDYPPSTGTARLSPDGTHLAFLSKQSLTGYDNTDQHSGLPDSELYLYDAGAEALTCASCNPTGERPLGPSAIPGAIPNGETPGATDSYKPRNLSTDGSRLFFVSADALVSRDTSAAADVYEWEAPGQGSCQKPSGCLFLISGGASPADSEFIDASATGRDLLFLTSDSLIRTDPGSVDLYDARELGGFPLPGPQIPCEGDACQAVPSPPEDPAPGTLVGGAANPAPHFPKPKKQKHHKKHHGKGHHHNKRGGK